MTEQLSILFVDDDPEDRMIFFEALKETGLNIGCEMLPDGEEALQYLKRTAKLPDFIFTDLNMVRMDGYEFCSELSKNCRYSFIPIVIYAGVITVEIAVELTRLGADYIFTKPVEMEAIKKIIISVIEHEQYKHQHLAHQHPKAA